MTWATVRGRVQRLCWAPPEGVKLCCAPQLYPPNIAQTLAALQRGTMQQQESQPHLAPSRFGLGVTALSLPTGVAVERAVSLPSLVSPRPPSACPAMRTVKG